MRHLFGIAVGSIGEREADIEAIGCGLHVQITVFEGGIGEAVAERIGRSNMLLLIPTLTYKILLCIIGNELLTTLITAITSEIDEDIAL